MEVKKFLFVPHQLVSGFKMFHKAVVSLTQCGFPRTTVSQDCGGLTLAGHQVPSTTRERRENITKIHELRQRQGEIKH